MNRCEDMYEYIIWRNTNKMCINNDIKKKKLVVEYSQVQKYRWWKQKYHWANQK